MKPQTEEEKKVDEIRQSSLFDEDTPTPGQEEA
jgi:hypothetical protein